MAAERQYSPHTIAAYLQDLDDCTHFLQGHFGGEELPPLPLASASLQDLRSWLAARLNRGFSHRSNARALSVLKTFIRFLAQREDIDLTPLLQMRAPRFGKSLPRPVSHTQVIALLDEDRFSGKLTAAPLWITRRDTALIALLYSTGLRISEALSLCPRDLAQDALIIRGKGKKERLMPLLENVRQLIKSYGAICPYPLAPEAPLFRGRQGKPLSAGVFQRYIRHLRRSQGLPESFTPHALRHTFATELLKHHVDLRTLQMLMGHESLVTTQKYIDVNSESLIQTYIKSHPRSMAPSDT